MAQKRRRRNRTVRMVAAILKSFSRETSLLGVSELSRKLGLAKSVVHEILNTLVDEGLVAKVGNPPRYVPGGEIFRIAHVIPRNQVLEQAAIPEMEKLHDLTGETVLLVGWIEKEVRCLAKIEGKLPVRLAVYPGDRFPLHAGSVGKLMLAFLPKEEQEKLLEKIPLTRFTKRTITDPHALRKELQRIREAGYVHSIGERVDDVASIGAPIRDSSGKVIAGIVIGGLTTHFTAEKLGEWIPALIDATRAVSSKLGFKGDQGENCFCPINQKVRR